ncbi:MAG: hypothetical protein IJP63_08890 [Acholeplasmatales bacterium]|nr:hypothetical protein [Acholeplasmatales bacterium]
MKKKHIILGAFLLSALVAGLCPFIAEAKTETVDENALVFNANDLKTNDTYGRTTKVSSSDGVTVKTGVTGFLGWGNYTAIVKEKTAVYSDYTFSKGLNAKGDSSKPSYSITASKGATVGIYYTIESSNAEAKLDVTYEGSIWFISTYTANKTYTVKSNEAIYTEYTFTEKETVGLRAANQSFWLYGVSIVSNEELENRTEAASAISNLINYYNANGASLTNEFEALVEKANEAIKSVNNLSQVSNYSEYENIVSEYKELVEDNTKANEVANTISNLGDVEYTEAYKNQLDEIEAYLENVKNVNFVSNYETFVEKKNAFNTLSDNARNAFEEKVNEANAVKGETSSYVLINEAEALYNELIESDKVLVAESANTLNEVKNAYTEMEAAVTDNTFAFSYNEDGSVYKVLFIGTINDFNSVSEIKKLFIYYTNESTGEETTIELHDVYQGINLAGKFVKEKADGVRYIYTKIVNDNNQYSGVTFSMYYEVTYSDGHIIKSNMTSIEVK